MSVVNVVVLTTILVGTTVASAAAAPVVMSERGLPGLRLGGTLAAARAAGLIGPLTAGCELASPRPYVAPLRAPLAGTVEFNGRGPRSRVSAIVVTKGAVTNRGIGVGSPSKKVRAAYPGARVVHEDQSLVYDAIIVRRGGADRIWFLLDKRGGRVQDIHIPSVSFCE